MIARIIADIRLTQRYTCALCLNHAEGKPQPTLISAESVDDLATALRSYASVPNPHYAPEGWGSFFNNAYKCPKCLLKEIKSE